MRYILVPDEEGTAQRQLPFYFAIEEYVATHCADDCFFIWQVPPTVMLGRNQLIEAEVNVDYCHKNDIHIFRRKSGGGCIYADEGCLQFSYVTSCRDVSQAFYQYMRLTAQALKQIGIPAELSGRNDILVNGLKVAGAAFYTLGGRRSVMHNSLLFNTQLGHLSQALTPSEQKLQSKGVRSVSQRVGNVGHHTQLTIEQFVARTREALCGNQVLQLTSNDLQQIHKIEAQLASDDFVYGKNPRYTVVRKLHIDGVGNLEAYVEVKNGIIKGINLMGDYFLTGDLDRDLLDRLKGVAFERQAVSDVLQGIDPGTVVRALTTQALLRLLFGRRPHVPKPDWLKIDLRGTQRSQDTAQTINGHGLHTICQSGLCPNRAECWRNGTATLMIGGNICTRACRFCNTPSGRPLPLDPKEPEQVARSIQEMKLRYAVITSVDRDDLPDLGAAHWASTIRAVRRMNPDTRIEVLIPDFKGNMAWVDTVLAAQPDVVGHNVETVRRLTPRVRSVATYEGSLAVLRHIAQCGFPAKTGIMLGLGEHEDEVLQCLRDICDTGCSLLTIGQYLQPTARHLPVVAYIKPSKFTWYREQALAMGFSHVESGPLVRSSYHAERIFKF